MLLQFGFFYYQQLFITQVDILLKTKGLKTRIQFNNSHIFDVEVTENLFKVILNVLEHSFLDLVKV